MRRFRFQILFFLRRSRKNRRDEYPIYLRLTVNGSQATIFTGKKIKNQFWNVKQGRVKKFNDDAIQLNDHLDSQSTNNEINEFLIRKNIFKVFNI